MLETIRQFAQGQLVSRGEATEARTAHARHFAGREADIMAVWDSPQQGEAYDWFNIELANLRAAFRWAVDHNDLDTAATIAIYATFLGIYVEQYEPVAWSEELVEPGRAIDHPRLAQLYVMASQCYVAGRIDDAVGYAKDGELAIASGRFDQVRYEFAASLSGVYMAKGDTEQWVELCRNMIARWPDAHAYALARLVLALVVAGASDEAMAASESLLAAADATDNPHAASVALSAYGMARRDSDPVAAYDVLRRGLRITQGSGNRQSESNLAVNLSTLAARHGDAMDALEYITLAIRNHYDSGSYSLLSQPLAVLATLFDQRGRYEPAATISRFASTPFTRKFIPELGSAISHLREVLGDEVYETFARTGETMTISAMATYAYDQIDQARAELDAVSK
jgi:tetratricopeptide (TPR) repeat protein